MITSNRSASMNKSVTSMPFETQKGFYQMNIEPNDKQMAEPIAETEARKDAS